MALAKITQVSGRAVPVRGDDLDTDRIIPARYMKCVTFDGLGEFMFYDVRFDEQGNQKQHPLNEERFKGATILISGNNFGCGSSREHAPQAIYRYGIRAVIAEGFAEIFFGNSTTLSLPCVSVSRADRETLQQMVEKDANTEITVDLEKKTVTANGKVFPCDIRESARQALTSGHWDPIAELLESGKKVDEVADKVGYMAVR
ncbi:MAG: 3-isopropylmalate dehydratase small subunit [Verrucomicrobiales bacterium]|jgi:3-isopropylmalate/(R)-2-methylmalate dehydratase small subunit|nr:3-isopropylmalate dehydratase small subunit [Verrucomicrobiales bacterium]